MTSPAGIDLGPLTPLADYLQEITEALAASDTQREVIEIILTPAVQALGATAGIVLLVDHTDQQMKIAGSQGYEDGLPTLWQEGPIENNVLIADILRMKEGLYFEHADELKAAYPQLESRTGGLLPVANVTLPMFLDGQPLGVIVLDFEEPHPFTPAERRFLKILSAQCAVALGRVRATSVLEDRVEERTRQLEERTRQLEEQTQQLKEERAAQGAFVAFTEAIGSETDLLALMGQATTVLRERFPDSTFSYYELEGELWRIRAWSDDFPAELLETVRAGLPSSMPMIREALERGEPSFREDWGSQQGKSASTEAYGAVTSYPLRVAGKVRHLLLFGLRGVPTWSRQDRALIRALGHGLELALERTEAARQLTLQNAELQAHARALEAFAELTRDLALTTDPLLLISRAQEVVMSMLLDGSAIYFVPEGDRWRNRAQYGKLRSPGLQAAVDAGLPYAEPSTLLIPWTTGRPYFQDVYDQNSDHLASVVGHVSATASLPLRIEGVLTGVLSFALLNNRTWSSVDRVVLETTVQSLELALDRAAKTRRLDEERTALETFTRFTRAAGSETDVQMLVQQAITLLEETRSVDVTYYEREGDLFKIRSWNAGLPAGQLARSLEGYSLDQPSFGRANRERQAVFEENWDAEQQGVLTSTMYRAVAIQPFCQDGEMIGTLIMASRTLSRWSERDKGVFQAVGQSLDLALDRARQTQTVTAQRDALESRTQELAARTRQLEDSTQELQAFSYSVSHDLRTPVRHIIGFLRLAQKTLDGRLDERSARYLEVVEQAAGQMNTLIDALLDLSNAAQRTLRPREIDLNEMMTQIRSNLTPDLTVRNVEWKVSPLPHIQGDWDALKQVLTQLTENALKFTRTRDPAVIRVWAEEQDKAWKVSVQDNGLGFDPRYQDRLFNLFQRLHTTKEASGTGVGLANVRRLILKHGGQVFAEGEIGKGATFGFTLPEKV